MKKELGIAMILMALCVFVTVMNHRFVSEANLQNMARLVGIFGIISLGMGIVIITGGIDLSVGSLFALQGVVLPMLLRESGWPWPAAVAAVIAGTMLLGALHGLIITRMRLQPFIVTLCGLLFYRGLARYIASDETKGFGDAEGFETLKAIATGSLLGVPSSFVLLLALAAVFFVVLHRSVYGRHLIAVGRNEDAARFSGIDTRRVVLTAYVLCAGLWGVAGILMAFYTNSVSPSSHGNFLEAYAVAAAVLGGCSLRGGEGSVLGILIGAALLQVLQNLVNLLGIPSSLNFSVMGAVILAGILIDQGLQSRGKRLATKVTEPAQAVAAQS